MGSSSESFIILSIKESQSDQHRVFRFHIELDGELIIANKTLSPENSLVVSSLSSDYNAMFEDDFAPGLLTDDLRVIGAKLFELWLGESWPLISARIKPGTQRTFIVASSLPVILNLPWEIMWIDGADFMGLDAKFTIRRVPWSDREVAKYNSPLRLRPLRILFMACAPKEEDQLDFEREEQAIIRAVAKAGPNIAFHSGDAGTFDEMRDLINEFRPHVVHLTGHGIVREDGLGYFLFENELGEMDPRSSIEMRKELFSGSAVQLAFISGCQTGKAPPIAAIGGICQGLVSEEIPLAIGWAASIADDIATQFASRFYRTLVTGETIDRALTQARQSIQGLCDERGYPGWTLPVLYSATTQSRIFDPISELDVPPKPSVVQRPLEGMTEGYTEYFVGRRREIQRLLPALREGPIRTLILTGLGGAGKSTLATKLARKLEAEGFVPIPISSSKDAKLGAARLIQSCGDAFLKAGLRDKYDTLHDGAIPVEGRLRFVVSTLNDSPFLLVLDNFEENLDEQTRGIIDREVRDFYKYLVEHLVNQSRAIITCRYLPSDSQLPSTAKEEALSDFPVSSFMKFMLHDSVLEQRYYQGELPRRMFIAIHRLLGGTPRFIAQIREAIKRMPVDELESELGKVAMPEGAQVSVLRKARDQYCKDIFAARLYGYLSEESRRALSCAAVYNIAVSVEGLAAAAAVPIETMRGFVREWHEYALACVDREFGIVDLWSVYGLLRGWLHLPERCSEQKRLSAHHAAGDFLNVLQRHGAYEDLGLTWIEVLAEERTQYIEAADYSLARAATDQLSTFLMMRGLYEDINQLNLSMLEYDEHPRSMIWIGRAHGERRYDQPAVEWFKKALKAAGEKFPSEVASALLNLATVEMNAANHDSARRYAKRSLQIYQDLNDLKAEAVCWNHLALIDQDIKDYNAARKKLKKAIRIRQKIGDHLGLAHALTNLAQIDIEQGNDEAARGNLLKTLRIAQGEGLPTGEAAAFFRLGRLAYRLGRLDEGTRLVALGFLLNQSLEHRNSEASFKVLSEMATQMGYSNKMFHAMLNEVGQEYLKNEGWHLLERAFPELKKYE